jgi:cytoskeleton protein RodZ
MSTTQLRHAREQRGLSLRDVADRTRIRVTILEAIENHDVDRLPPPIFTRGFVKAYAREVGLDPEAAAALYATPGDPPGAASGQAPQARRASADDRSGSYSLSDRERSTLVTAALIVVAGMLFVLTDPWKPSPVENTSANPAVATAEDAAAVQSAVATTGETRRTIAAAPRTANMRIDLAPHADCWIEATADGERVIYKLLNGGDRYAIEGYDELLLKVGDPSALVYSINGATGRRLGPAGQPTMVHITSENSRSFAN